MMENGARRVYQSQKQGLKGSPMEETARKPKYLPLLGKIERGVQPEARCSLDEGFEKRHWRTRKGVPAPGAGL